jgi:hypothetical protein
MNYAPEYERQRHDFPADTDRAAAYRIGLVAASASRRRSPVWFAALAIVASLAIAGGVFSMIAYRRANVWEERTRAAELHAADVQTRLDATNAELDLAQTELKVMSIGLTASNKERDALQARIDAVTAEKATVEAQQQQVADDQQLSPEDQQPPVDNQQVTDQSPDGGVSATSDP